MAHHREAALEPLAIVGGQIFPPGPIGLGFISPSVVHFPTKYPRRLCSGPGDWGPGGCAAATTENPTDTTTQSARSGGILFIGFLQSVRAS